MRKLFTAILLLACMALHAPLAHAQSPMLVTCLDIGQGEVTLVQCGGEAALIHTGPAQASGTLFQRLLDLHVTTLQYVFVFDAHTDHIGNLDSLIKFYDIGTLLAPTLAEADGSCYRKALLRAAQRGIPILPPTADSRYPLGDAMLTILPSGDSLRIQHGGISLVLTGGRLVTPPALPLPDAPFSLYSDGATLSPLGIRR